MPERSSHAPALAEALRRLTGRLRRRLREQSGAGPLDFTDSQISVVVRLDRDGPATVSALARAEHMRPQSMGAILSALEASGHLAASPDPSDGRQTLYDLTPATRARIKDGRALKQEWLARTIAERLSAEEQAALAAALPLIDRLLEP